MNGCYGKPLFKLMTEFDNRLRSHTIQDEVSTGITEDTFPKPVLPVVVMGEPSHTRFDSSEYYRDIREQLLEDSGIDDSRIFRPAIMTAVRTIFIL
jgi:hypothetical protein